MAKRPGALTTRRRQVLAAYEAAAREGGPVPAIRRLAREIGVYCPRDVRRIRNDLVKLGRL